MAGISVAAMTNTQPAQGLGLVDGEPSLMKWSEPSYRSHLVARTRWILLVLFSTYGLYAGGMFLFSRLGIYLSKTQIGFLLASLAGVAGYNWLLSAHYAKLAVLPFLDHLQIILDLLFITVLVHFTGGASSWLWPVYLMATIEAAFLLPRRIDVWLVGAAGAAMNGLLLASYYFGLLRPVPIPFISNGLAYDGFFLCLCWVWIATLNTTVALISAFFMSIIRKEQSALSLSQKRLQDFVDTANDLIFCISPDGRLRYVNPVWQKTMGYSLADLESTPFHDLIDMESRYGFLKHFHRTLAGETGTAIEGKLLARNGGLISLEGTMTRTIEGGRAKWVWCICRDVTDKKSAEAQLYQLAHFDMLTGLPNRSTLLDRIEKALALARRSHQRTAILFLDLDRFKLINDTLGHAVGDELLRAVGVRLQKSVREIDTISRIGGDEFIVSLVNMQSLQDICALASKLLKPMSRPFVIGDRELFVTASLGISVYPEDGEDPETLIKKADIAMYHAKRRGRNNHQFYSTEMEEDVCTRLQLINDLRRALEQEELRVFYQPKHHTQTGRITSMEALARWEHPELGLLSPNEFIPLAEETGLILPLGEWVLRTVAEQHVRWTRQGLAPVRVGVNLSGYQLQQPGFLDVVCDILDKTGMSPEFLEFEITETVLMQNPERAAAILAAFRANGIRISIDDFGTGYSSLAHLKRFDVSALKIDKSFVKGIERDATNAALAKAILALGAILNLDVVAEGVETKEQLQFLQEANCHEVQGYLFSEPVPGEQIPEYLKTHQALDVNEGIRAQPLDAPTPISIFNAETATPRFET